MNWIIKPNQWYDKIEEPNRMLLFLIIMISIQVGFWLMDLYYVGLLIFALIGLYRVVYFIIMDKNKKKEVKEK